MSKQRIPSTVKSTIWSFYCGQHNGSSPCMVGCGNLIYMNNFECGHIISESLGGPVHIHNLIPICGKCNKSMGTHNMIEFIAQNGFPRQFNLEAAWQRSQQLPLGNPVSICQAKKKNGVACTNIASYNSSYCGIKSHKEYGSKACPMDID
jgi:hypothetical protein